MLSGSPTYDSRTPKHEVRHLCGRPGAVRVHNGRTTGESGQARRRRERRSGGATFVVVMQPANVRDLDDRAAGWRLGNPRDGSILVQREVSAPLVIVREVALQVTVQRALVPHDDVIEALASEGANHAFSERILPGTTRRRQYFFDAHLLQGTPRIRSVHRIPSRMTNRGTLSHGHASRSCCAVHAAVGCAVTFTWTMRRRS